ncbi:MAG: substrate-binding domain-containing protein [Bdellovibrio sp.]|nr:substrate-binding domain-containing protein [Bdellovibrio sp.]
MKHISIYLFLIMSLSSTFGWAKSLSVHVFYWSAKIEAQVSMRKGLEEEIANYNKTHPDLQIDLTAHLAGDGRQGVLNQIKQLEDALAKRPDALVIQPTDISTVSKALQEANTLKIPVFTFDQFIVLGKITSYIASDNYQAGWDNGSYLDSLVPRNQEMKIVLFEYPRVSAVINRLDGFFDALRAKKRKFVVLKRYEAVTAETGLEKTREFLKEFPKKKSVDVIFTVNDGAGITIANFLWDKGRREILHATVDGDPIAIEAIKQKKLTVIDSAQFCAEMGRETARQLIAHFTGGSVTARKLIPTFPVTHQTAANFTGWMGPPVAPPKDFSGFSNENRIIPIEPNKLKGTVIRIGMAPHCPYLCEQGPGQWGGYVYEILKDLSEKMNFKVELVNLSNSELTKALKNRQVNYIIIPSYFVRYLSDITVYGPKLGVSYTGALFTPGVRMHLVDKESLSDMRIAFAKLGQESDLNLDPEEFKKSLKIDGADVADRMIKAIGERRVDLALGDYNVLRYTLLRRQQLNLELQPTSLTGFNTLSLVGPPEDNSPVKLPAYLQNWLINSRENGRLDKILRKYNLPDWSAFNH